MTETTMNLGAVALELGLPAGLLMLMMIKPKMLPRVIVIFGAVFPALCPYVATTASYLLSRGRSDGFAFHAMWVMTFAAYVAAALGGLATSFLRRPQNVWLRFCAGLLSAPSSYAALVLVAPLMPW